MTEAGKMLAKMTQDFAEAMSAPESHASLEKMTAGSSVTVRRTDGGLTVTIWMPVEAAEDYEEGDCDE